MARLSRQGSHITRELIELATPVERAILVGTQAKRPYGRGNGDGAPVPGAARTQAMNQHLDELARLADTAGAMVAGRLTQQIDRANPATYLGKGKIEELAREIAASSATLVIFDDELTPAQAKNVEDATGTRVMDRAELILDIFATRAQSSEAKMQVELAQLEYMLPRLTRMWTHLEKFRGGIGMRGPGETQLETDRRLVANRIRVLRERLRDVQKSREVQRMSRKGHFRASLVGYTNAGKSSILRGLSGANGIVVEDRLFATLDPLTREIPLGESATVLLTDTVGFIRKLPHHLVASFRATLEEVLEADLLLHVVDVSHPSWEEQREVVEGVLAGLGAAHKPMIHVFNKADRLSNDDVAAVQVRIEALMPGSVFVSAISTEGLEPLKQALLAAVRARRPIHELRVPLSDGGMLAQLYRETEVLDQRTEGDTMVVTARIDPSLLGRLEGRGVRIAG